MAATTRENIIAIAPNLVSVAIATFDLVIADVALEVLSADYGTQQERGQRYLAAHFLTLTQRKGSGAVTWDKVGEVEKRFQNLATGGESTLGETSYGVEFMRIRDSVIVPFDVVAFL